MEQDEKLKFVYEQIVGLSKYFLDWRHKLLAGYIVVISALYYFILTWIRQPEHFDVSIYCLSCGLGIMLTIFFMLLNHRNNAVIWKYQNNGYLFEKKLGFKDNSDDNSLYGLYGNVISEGIKRRLNTGDHTNIKLTMKDRVNLFRLDTHVGIMNWFYLFGIASFVILLSHTSRLKEETKTWKAIGQKVQTI